MGEIFDQYIPEVDSQLGEVKEPLVTPPSVTEFLAQFNQYFNVAGETDYLRQVVTSILGEGAPPSPQEPLRMVPYRACLSGLCSPLLLPPILNPSRISGRHLLLFLLLHHFQLPQNLPMVRTLVVKVNPLVTQQPNQSVTSTRLRDLLLLLLLLLRLPLQ
jgi:hypothetical protein